MFDVYVRVHVFTSTHTHTKHEANAYTHKGSVDLWGLFDVELSYSIAAELGVHVPMCALRVNSPLISASLLH